MLNFCTLFNSAYLSRGLAMYLSLEKCCAAFHLYIFAFDEECFNVLSELDLRYATIVRLADFEDHELLGVKPDRTAGEYCWTCTSSTIWYCIRTFGLDHCTYIDADLLFFRDPKVLIDEMGDKSVLITEHRYSPQHDQSALSGIYCVQFITFKNDEAGREALLWWRNACLDWCYKRFEDGKFGDQKYLDDWTTRFTGVHVLRHLGGGVAPWNVDKYRFRLDNGILVVTEPATGREENVVFYHFHDFRYCVEKVFRLTAEQYRLNKEATDLLYRPYINTLYDAEALIAGVSDTAVFHEPLLNLDWIMTNMGRKTTFLLQGYYRNYYRTKKFKRGRADQS